MIITGENAKLVPKGAKDNAINPGTDRAGGMSHPPSYQATQPPFQPYVQPQVFLQRITYRRSPARRFWGAFATAILVWVLVTMLVRSWYDILRRHWRFGEGEFSIPSDVSLSHCVVNDHGWSHIPYPSQVPVQEPAGGQFPYSSSTAFELPLSYETLFLLARGAQTRGTVNVITSDDVSDTVKVHLTVKYVSKHDRDREIKVCLLQREPNTIGVGYFTRNSWYRRLHSVYEATVVIPASRIPESLQQIKTFKTDMSNTNHRLGDLQGLVSFSHLSLKGSNSPIYAKSIHADTAVFRTSNGAITGFFNASRSLTLHTSNAPIQADVTVANEDEYVSDLTLRTSNGKIDSRVSLTATEGDQYSSRYLVAATTSNALLAVNFPSSPLASILRVTASTSNGPAHFSLPPAYEGEISMSTSNSAPSIKRRDVVDPSGKGRVRRVRTTSLTHNTLQGSVSWSNEEGPGKVNLRSSNSPIVIEL
ncbi:hypothetical protein DXG01_010113 [Tephrocybe rancida]|nr:hypothetical protein DXG01_010113 [Tephrocybe rancida]